MTFEPSLVLLGISSFWNKNITEGEKMKYFLIVVLNWNKITNDAQKSKPSTELSI